MDICQKPTLASPLRQVPCAASTEDAGQWAFPPAADDYDGLPPPGCEPPSPEQMELESDARYIGGHFRNIAVRPWEPWFIISHAGRSLVRLAANRRRPERLPARKRDKLIGDILTGRQALHEAFSGGDVDLEHMLSEAFDGALVLANHLAESDEERAARHPHVVLDASARLMIAVSAARAHCLGEEIRRRADQRITDEVAATVAEALEVARKAAA